MEKQQTLTVNEIYPGIDGEPNGFSGVGEPTLFLRLQGCNLRCSWCDTPYGQSDWEDGQTKEIPVPDLLDQLVQYRYPKLTITGGEPLRQCVGLGHLLQNLYDYRVSIETNGSIDLGKVMAHWSHLSYRLDSDRTCWYRFVMDWKLPSSGMEERMIPENLRALRPWDMVKFVIADHNDYLTAIRTLHTAKTAFRTTPVFSPVHTTLSPTELVKWMLEDNLKIMLGFQLHKLLWPGKRGV